MKHTRIAKTLKSFSLAVAGVCALATGLLFASCDNFGGDVASFDPALFFVAGGTQDAAGGTNVGQCGGQAVGAFAAQSLGSLSANVSIPNMTALPTATTTPSAIQASDGAANASALDISNSALPDIADATGTGYKFTATLAQAGAGGATYTAEGTYAAGVCSFEFADARSSAEQNYTLTVSLYYSDALVASGEKAVTVAAGATDFTADVSLAPNTASGASNGTLALPIKFSDTSVTSVGVNLIDSGGTDVAATYVEGGSTVALTSGAGTIASVTGGLPPGTYTLLMTFKKGSAQVGARTETLNVYPTLATKVWWTNSSTGLVSELVITSYDQTEFWVKGEGGVFYSDVYTAYTGAGLDTNVGTFFAPLKTIQEAVDRINDAGDTTTQYTVYIDGKVTGDPDSNDSSLAYINKARKILFKGWTGPDTDIIDVNKNWESSPLYPTRAFYIYAAATITAQNLGITNASSGTSSDGGAIGFNAAANGAVVTLENCKISGCGAQNGGAISVYNGTLNLKQCSVYHNNATRDGGGIYVDGQAASTTILVTIEDSQIYDNTATATSYGNGGGIYVKTNARVNFKSGVIGSDDTTKGNKCKNGGGVDVASGGIFEMSGSARIVGNSASNNGGGIYVAGGQAIFSSGIIGSDDPSKGNTAKNGGGVWVSSSGKFSMSGSSRVSGNSATTYGGGIYSEGQSLMGGSSQVCGNTANSGGGVFISAGCFCMSGSAIVGAAPTGLTEAAQADDAKHSNKATNDGGGIFTYTPSRLKLGYENETTPDPTFSGGIYYNYANNGGGIYASSTASTATIEMGRGSVCYNGAAGEGGGICTYSLSYDAPFKMTGGEVSNNSAASGGGVYAKAVYVGGGKVAGNTASNYGGGVYAGSDFYLYGSGVIGDMSKAEIAKEDDCSNKAKAGGGVYSHKVYIGYSDASTPAACTGGIYRNYATAVKGSETYFYGGGGICIRGTSADWLFKMQSGTVAYNAGDSSDGYGGGLFIYGSGVIDSSIAYPEVTGGSFVGNGAKYGGAVCCYTDSLAVGGSVHMPSATGEKGDNDIYINNDACCLHLASAFDAATPTPVLTATPSAYSPGKKIFDSSIGSECSKIEIASNSDGWAVKNDGTLYKPTRAVYIASVGAGGSDGGDGTIDHPYLSIDKASQAFTEPKLALVDRDGDLPEFKNKIYVLSDMTYDDGAGSSQDAYFEIVGAGGTGHDQPVQFIFNTPREDHSGIYIQPGQKVKFTNINFTQTAAEANAYSAIIVPPENTTTGKPAGEAFFDGCTIMGIRATKCSAISAEGDVHLKNVSIKNNVAVATSDGAYSWGPAVFSKQGKISLLGKIEICGNKMEVPDGAGGTILKPQNVWIGDNKSGAVYYEQLRFIGALDPTSSIGVTTYDSAATVITSGWATYNASLDPADVFESDAGLAVFKNASGEAELKKPTDIYVSSTTSDPAGDDGAGTGSASSPLESVAKALQILDGYDEPGADYTIHINGTITGNVYIPDGLRAATITIAGTDAAESCLDGVDWTDSVVNVATDTPVVLSKLTITRGTHGVYVGDSDIKAQVSIENCVITDNQSALDTSVKAGAGVYANMLAGSNAAGSGKITIIDTQITSNKAAAKGGGIHIESGVLSCQDCVIQSNSALNGAGGGISADKDSKLKGFTIEGGEISGNTASTNGGGMNIAPQSGAIPLVNGVKFEGNKATGTGDNGNGGAIQVTTGKYLTINNCQIKSNEAKRGAGVYAAGKVTITGGTISGNTASQDGGGVYSQSESASLSITDTVISGNKATGLGGGVYSGKGFTLGDGAYIPAGTDGKNDVYLTIASIIQVASPLTATPAPVATITPELYGIGNVVLTLAATSTATLEDSISKFAVTANALSSWTVVKNLTGTAGVLRAANSSTGGVTISFGGGVSFDITKPTASSMTASFKVFDGTDEVAAADLSDLQIKILKKTGVVVYSAAAQSVTADYLSAGDYDLYCHAVYDGIPYDTTVGFTILNPAPSGFVAAEGSTVTGGGLTPESEVFIESRTVAIPSLYVCDHEVTQGEYETYCKYGGTAPGSSKGFGSNYPVYFVNWYDALVYCNLRSKEEGLDPVYKLGTETDPTKWSGIAGSVSEKWCGPSSSNSAWDSITCDWTANGYRLPTEAEWEYLARNKNKDSYTYAGSDTIGNVCWYRTNSSNKTHEVKANKVTGMDSANGLGVYDMSGNVCEWCWDWSGTITSGTAASGLTSGEKRIMRGGYYYSFDVNSTVASRMYDAPYNRVNNIGFRVVRKAQ